MKRIPLILFLLFIINSCKKDEQIPEVIQEIKEVPIKIEYGFNMNDFHIVHDTIRRGDNLGIILGKQNIGNYKVHDITEKIKDSINLRDLRIGKPYILLQSKDTSQKLKAFIYLKDIANYAVIDLRDSIVGYQRQKPITYKQRTIASEINSSLSETLQNEGVSAGMAQNLANIYAYSVDFFKLQKGDKFAVTFTEKYISDTIFAGVESMQASFFEHKGKKIYAFPFKNDPNSNRVDFYDEEGKVLKNMFLKAPLKFGYRISSRFSKSRFHPVQKRYKAHGGTDYAAAHGTPIITTASGVVETTGFTAGNGNYVKVKHNSTYTTQYLHMSKILVKKGQRVSQGDVIGKVGSTGLATGPHVCYRFWKNGVQVDPLTHKMPNSEPMDARLKPRFLQEMAPQKKSLDSIAAIAFKEK